MERHQLPKYLINCPRDITIRDPIIVMGCKIASKP